MEVQGARSIEERFEEQPNAQEVAEAWKAEGYKGCWVLALGTNEAADVAAGSSVGLSERIEKMMNIIGDEPVLWVNVKTLPDATEFYAEEGMKKWDEELETACLRYPNMRIYNWAADVKDAWFIDDGIHFTSPGYAARAELIAHALAHAFPAKGDLARAAPNASSAEHRVGASLSSEQEDESMPDPNQRDAKLIQYLSEAYGKERELEMALQVDIAMTTKAAVQKTAAAAPQRDESARQSARPPDQETRRRRPDRRERWSAKRPRSPKARCTWSAATASRRSC